MNPPHSPSLGVLAGRIGRQLSGLGVAAAAPTVAAFLLLPVFTHYLAPAEFGVWALLQVVGVIFSAVGGLGMLGAAPFYYTEGGPADARRRKMGNLLLGVTAVNVLLLIFWAGTGRPLLEWLFPGIPFELVMLSLAQAALIPYLDGPVVAWKMAERSVTVAGMSLLRVFLISAAQLVAIVGMSGGLPGLVWGTFAGTLAASIVHMGAFRTELVWWFSASELKNALKLGLPSIPNASFVNIYRYADRIILERFVSHDLIGVYYLALRFGDLLKLGIDVFTQAWTPVFYKEALDRAKRPALAHGAALLTVLFCGGALVSSIFGEVYVRWFVNVAYHDAILLIPLAITAQLLKGLYSFPHLSIWLSKKSYWFPAITVVPMIASLAANLWVIPIWGIRGAALVMIGAFGLHALLTYWIGQRVLPLPYRYGSMSCTVIAGLGATFLASTLSHDAGFAVRAGVGIALYSVFALAMIWWLIRRHPQEIAA